ncbi:tRNA (adenosine(37)-N6)-threonylcarbamoyltransferase complex dimerization subunit type 1 TsaB [bacterium (Candidatus Howlettbacteria) CG_4_10_14_0_8_um_filter_40_9]|nr:MAG: tRNA (adenosine(37)-N6)-threonylcarbamoyltransferase complex dimerization subunit type 1 TsaB [bacterium (Candidatus Howlettbacteria) CG_4_10_14_0_8_um_filter_40_9]
MKNKNLLLIDTSSTFAQISLADDEKVFDEESWEVIRNLSDKLLPNIEKLMAKNKVKPEDLNGVIIYLGPGTYTGLRVGVTVANAFAYSLDIPIAGVKGKSFGNEKFIVSELKPIDLEKLLAKGKKILANKSEKSVAPFYGKKPNVG